ncbi:hypothetical protein STEG23_011767 [Scotinomys teguina]
MHVDMVLEKELVVLHLDLQAAEAIVYHTEHSLSKGDLKVHRHNDTFPPISDPVVKHPTHSVKNRKQQVPVTDPFTLCLDIIDKEVGFQATDSCFKMLNYRCSGCIVVRKLNSRNFSKLLHSCAYQCDHHKVIMEAEDKYKSELRKALLCDKEAIHQKPDIQKLPSLEERACNTNIPEAKARRFQVPDQLGLHNVDIISMD